MTLTTASCTTPPICTTVSTTSCQSFLPPLVQLNLTWGCPILRSTRLASWSPSQRRDRRNWGVKVLWACWPPPETSQRRQGKSASAGWRPLPQPRYICNCRHESLYQSPETEIWNFITCVICHWCLHRSVNTPAFLKSQEYSVPPLVPSLSSPTLISHCQLAPITEEGLDQQGGRWGDVGKLASIRNSSGDTSGSAGWLFLPQLIIISLGLSLQVTLHVYQSDKNLQFGLLCKL